MKGRLWAREGIGRWKMGEMGEMEDSTRDREKSISEFTILEIGL